MKVIFFKSSKELIYFCGVYYQKYRHIRVTWKRHTQWGNKLKLYHQVLIPEKIITCLIDVFIQFRLKSIMINILKDVYYYTDDTEIDHICSMTKELLWEKKILHTFLNHLFEKNIKEADTIYFDVILTFSKNEIYEFLLEMVGNGIDEVKREESYQHFIDSVRIYINRKEYGIDVLHILQGEPFTFYKTNGKCYSQIELREIMLKEPLYINGLDENEWNISPVISLNPKRIFIYGNIPEEAKTISLIKIFEERIRFVHMQDFPFSITK